MKLYKYKMLFTTFIPKRTVHIYTRVNNSSNKRCPDDIGIYIYNKLETLAYKCVHSVVTLVFGVGDEIIRICPWGGAEPHNLSSRHSQLRRH